MKSSPERKQCRLNSAQVDNGPARCESSCGGGLTPELVPPCAPVALDNQGWFHDRSTVTHSEGSACRAGSDPCRSLRTEPPGSSVKGYPADHPIGDEPEKAFDLVGPGTAGGSEVKMEPASWNDTSDILLPINTDSRRNRASSAAATIVTIDHCPPQRGVATATLGRGHVAVRYSGGKALVRDIAERVRPVRGLSR